VNLSDRHLQRDEVHLWQFKFEPRLAASLSTVLSETERERASRFVFAHDAARYVFAHGVLRLLLAEYIDEQPAHIRFSLGIFGKPALAHEGTDVAFNISHSGDYIVCGVSQGRAIGADVERIRLELDIQSLARRFFTKRELEEIESLPECVRTEACFHAWSRKEAFTKAVGEGLRMPLDSFTVSVDPTASQVALTVPRDERESARWSLNSLGRWNDYVGAIAVETDRPLVGRRSLHPTLALDVHAILRRWSL
jgi:4'-phosphopantetheinyl transferase